MTEETAEYTPPERYTILSNEPELPAAVTDEVATPEPEAVETETETETETEQTPEAKKKDAQSRIRQLANENRELKEWKAAQEAEKAQPVIAPADKPNPADFVGGKFNDDYQDALEAWNDARVSDRIAQALAERETKQAVQTQVQTIKARENAFRETHTDYDDVFRAVDDSGIIDDQLVLNAIIELENSPEIIYQIGNDEDLLYQLAVMTPAQRLMKIGALSARASGTTAPPAARISQAAKPITPVSGGKAVLTGAAAIEAAEKAMDYDAWKAAKAAK